MGERGWGLPPSASSESFFTMWPKVLLDAVSFPSVRVTTAMPLLPEKPEIQPAGGTICSEILNAHAQPGKGVGNLE
jgi:hypothetical protein